MAPAAAVIGCREVREFLGDAVIGDIKTVSLDRSVARPVVDARTGHAAEKVHTVTDSVRDERFTADDSRGNVGNIIVGSPAIGKSGRIASEPAEPSLILRLSRGDGEVEA